eukprot:CAMPEP_0168365526 /NCGR_PEP_ID=MMETSP0228-20121227/4763_1 /TAXON_ID=133427 /ORGANISM="Protoceratium reticulatum, Strain CCCM 535 (=CCMP 1889)" /LENGTH=205 /DNA_ID=CAMNT_0008378309 /DNA_START=314 /DNA_END=928 /DNA_ORIENTATION=+
MLHRAAISTDDPVKVRRSLTPKRPDQAAHIPGVHGPLPSSKLRSARPQSRAQCCAQILRRGFARAPPELLAAEGLASVGQRLQASTSYDPGRWSLGAHGAKNEATTLEEAQVEERLELVCEPRAYRIPRTRPQARIQQQHAPFGRPPDELHGLAQLRRPGRHQDEALALHGLQRAAKAALGLGAEACLPSATKRQDAAFEARPLP